MRRNFTKDTDLEMKDAGLVAASAAAQVDSAAQVLDLGAGFVSGNVVIDITAIEIADNDEIFDIVFQLTNTAAFATDTAIVDRCSMTFCAKEVQRTDCNADSVIGRYILPVDNEIAGTVYRYARLYTVCAGTVGTVINYVASLCKD